MCVFAQTVTFTERRFGPHKSDNNNKKLNSLNSSSHSTGHAGYLAICYQICHQKKSYSYVHTRSFSNLKFYHCSMDAAIDQKLMCII